MTFNELRHWVLSNDFLYHKFKYSKLGIERFIETHERLIKMVIRNNS